MLRSKLFGLLVGTLGRTICHMIHELHEALLTQEGLYSVRIADAKVTLKARDEELAGYKRYALRIGEILSEEVYLACRVSLYRWCCDKYVSAYEPDGSVIVQTIEPAGFEEGLSELALGLQERNFRRDDAVVDTIEVVSERNVSEGLILPSRWSRNWFRTVVMGLEPYDLSSTDNNTPEKPTVYTPPRYFEIPQAQQTEVIAEPVRKAKVLVR